MPLIIPVGYGQAVYELILTGDSEPMVVTMGHDLSAYLGDHQEAAEALHFYFGEHVMPMLPSAYSHTAVDLYVGQAEGPPLVFSSTGAPVAGDGGAAFIPQNSALLVRKRTDLAGRRGRGRIYLPGVEEALVDGAGNLTPAAVTGYQTQLDNWFEALNDTSTEPFPHIPAVILHRSEGEGAEPPPTTVASFQLEDKIATQRRRLRP